MPSSYPRVTIRSAGDQPFGRDCLVEIDGRPLTTVTAVSFTASVDGLVMVNLTMVATVDVDMPAVLEQVESHG